jgi:hypothetical protein
MKPRCAQDLALTEKCLPHKWGKIPHRANAKTRDGREHGPLSYADSLCLQIKSDFVKPCFRHFVTTVLP